MQQSAEANTKKKGSPIKLALILVVVIFGGLFLLVMLAGSGNSSSATNTATKPQVDEKDDVVAPVATEEATQPAATEKTYQEVFTFSGTGNKKSEPFTITGSRFKIAYDCKGDLCQAWLKKVGSELPEIIMNGTGPLKDETIIYGSGEYYIEANTIGSYTMSVQDYR